MKSGVDLVRWRPGMFLGNLDDGAGVAQMVWDAIDNALDEHSADPFTRLAITIAPDDTITVVDDGRGLRVDAVTHTLPDGQVRTLPFAELALTELHPTPIPHGQLVGVEFPLCVINALSAWLHLETHRDGRRWEQRFARGVPTSTLVDCGPTTERGTRLTHFVKLERLDDGGNEFHDE